MRASNANVAFEALHGRPPSPPAAAGCHLPPEHVLSASEAGHLGAPGENWYMYAFLLKMPAPCRSAYATHGD